MTAPAIEAVRRLPRLLGRGLVKTYRYTFSPLVGFDCRHLPTCSEYADEALGRFGLWLLPWRFGRWRGTNRGPAVEAVEGDQSPA